MLFIIVYSRDSQGQVFSNKLH